MYILKILFTKKKGKLLIPAIIFGLFGLIIEVFSRALSGSMVGFDGLQYVSLMGYTSILMIPIYMIGGTIASCINDFPKFFRLKMIWQTLIVGGLIITIEYLGGCICNLWLNLNLWDYSEKFLNLNGQICLETSLLWVFASPAFIWFADLVGSLLYKELWYYHILDNYKQLFTGK